MKEESIKITKHDILIIKGKILDEIEKENIRRFKLVKQEKLMYPWKRIGQPKKMTQLEYFKSIGYEFPGDGLSFYNNIISGKYKNINKKDSIERYKLLLKRMGL